MSRCPKPGRDDLGLVVLARRASTVRELLGSSENRREFPSGAVDLPTFGLTLMWRVRPEGVSPRGYQKVADRYYDARAAANAELTAVQTAFHVCARQGLLSVTAGPAAGKSFESLSRTSEPFRERYESIVATPRVSRTMPPGSEMSARQFGREPTVSLAAQSRFSERVNRGKCRRIEEPNLCASSRDATLVFLLSVRMAIEGSGPTG